MPKKRFPFGVVELGVLIGLALTFRGYQSFVAIRGEWSTIHAEVLTFGLGVYALLVSVVLGVRHFCHDGSLRMPKFILVIGLPACLCIATALEYSFIPFPGGDGADPGFWDSKLETMIDLEGQIFWTFLAIASSLSVAVLFLIWIWPALRSTPPRPPDDENPLAKESDFERTYGWFIEKEGRKIGELEYLRWDWSSQFWHDYKLTWHNPADAVLGPDEWILARLVLRNRKLTDVVVDSFLTGSQHAPGIISVRSASVPVEKLG